MKTARLLTLGLAALGLSLSIARSQDASTVPPPPLPETAPTTPQNGAPPQHRHAKPGYVLADLTAKLGLTAEQQATVGSIIAGARTQMKAARADDTLSKEDRRAKMRQIVDASRVQIRAALTPDQQKTFDALPAPGQRQ